MCTFIRALNLSNHILDQEDRRLRLVLSQLKSSYSVINCSIIGDKLTVSDPVFGRISTWIRNKTGSKVDPWGIPLLMLPQHLYLMSLTKLSVRNL